MGRGSCLPLSTTAVTALLSNSYPSLEALLLSKSEDLSAPMSMPSSHLSIQLDRQTVGGDDRAPYPLTAPCLAPGKQEAAGNEASGKSPDAIGSEQWPPVLWGSRQEGIEHLVADLRAPPAPAACAGGTHTSWPGSWMTVAHRTQARPPWLPRGCFRLGEGRFWIKSLPSLCQMGLLFFSAGGQGMAKIHSTHSSQRRRLYPRLFSPIQTSVHGEA